jgi:hypothetical protein
MTREEKKEARRRAKSAEDLGRELLRAAEEGDVERVKELLQCERGHAEVALLLLEHGGETKQELEGALCWAAREGHAVVVKMLMERGADPCVHENLAFCLAAQNGHVDVVKLLLQDERVNPSAEDNYAVYSAGRNGHCDVVEVLLADSRVDGSAAIHRADPRAVHVLLEDERCGIHVNRERFLKHHKEEVVRFEKLVKKRTARICAMSWVMKIIGNGWGDLREPTEERMAKQPVN